MRISSSTLRIKMILELLDEAETEPGVIILLVAQAARAKPGAAATGRIQLV